MDFAPFPKTNGRGTIWMASLTVDGHLRCSFCGLGFSSNSSGRLFRQRWKSHKPVAIKGLRLNRVANNDTVARPLKVAELKWAEVMASVRMRILGQDLCRWSNVLNEYMPWQLPAVEKMLASICAGRRSELVWLPYAVLCVAVCVRVETCSVY